MAIDVSREAWGANAWMAASAADPDWPLRLRQAPLPPAAWALVPMPGLALCVLPALLEYRDALRAAQESHDAGRA